MRHLKHCLPVFLLVLPLTPCASVAQSSDLSEDAMADWVSRNVDFSVRSEWGTVGATPDFVVLITDGLMVVEWPEVSYWQRMEFVAMQKDVSGQPFKSNLQRVRVDCAKFRINLESITFYEQQNLAGKSITVSIDDKFTPVAPGTMGEQSLKEACRLGRAMGTAD